jgi:hypothetical protein
MLLADESKAATGAVIRRPNTPRSVYEPELLLRIINKKKSQFAEIEGELQRLPLDHPTRPRWLERMLHLQQGIPALEADYERRSGKQVAKDKAPVLNLRASIGAGQSLPVTRDGHKATAIALSAITDTPAVPMKVREKQNRVRQKSPQMEQAIRDICAVFDKNPTARAKEVCDALTEHGTSNPCWLGILPCHLRVRSSQGDRIFIDSVSARVPSR